MGQRATPGGLPRSGLRGLRCGPTLGVVIHDVDESLRALVKRDVLAGNGVEIAFDAPTKEWVAWRNVPGLEPAAAGVLAETRRAGTRRQPGRTLRLRDTRGPEG